MLLIDICLQELSVFIIHLISEGLLVGCFGPFEVWILRVLYVSLNDPLGILRMHSLREVLIVFRSLRVIFEDRNLLDCLLPICYFSLITNSTGIASLELCNLVTGSILYTEFLRNYRGPLFLQGNFFSIHLSASINKLIHLFSLVLREVDA